MKTYYIFIIIFVSALSTQLCNATDTLHHYLNKNCSSFMREISYKIVSNFKGFDDTETYFEDVQSSNLQRILGFKIDKEIFNHHTKNYQFLIKESKQIYKFDIVIDWNSNDSFVPVTTPELFAKQKYGKKIFFRVIKTDVYGNQAVLVVNNANIYMVLSNGFTECKSKECIKRFKDWNNTKSKCRANDDYLRQLYFTNCPGNCSILYRKIGMK